MGSRQVDDGINSHSKTETSQSSQSSVLIQDNDRSGPASTHPSVYPIESPGGPLALPPTRFAAGWPLGPPACHRCVHRRARVRALHETHLLKGVILQRIALASPTCAAAASCCVWCLKNECVLVARERPYLVPSHPRAPLRPFRQAPDEGNGMLRYMYAAERLNYHRYDDTLVDDRVIPTGWQARGGHAWSAAGAVYGNDLETKRCSVLISRFTLSLLAFSHACYSAYPYATALRSPLPYFKASLYGYTYTPTTCIPG